MYATTLLEVSGGDRTRIHGTVVQRFRIGQHDDHLFRTLGESGFNGLWHMDLVGPLFRADGIPVQCVHDGIAAMLVFLVAGRQKHEHVAVNCVALQATFESVAVDLYVLDHHRLRSGNDRGTSV
jgi:hypothetical protein